MRDLLRDPWWKRILAGDTTAIPVEWEAGSGSYRLAGETAREFMGILKEYKIKPTGELAKACGEYITRLAIERTGEHPNGMARKDWEETYGEDSDS